MAKFWPMEGNFQEVFLVSGDVPVSSPPSSSTGLGEDMMAGGETAMWDIAIRAGMRYNNRIGHVWVPAATEPHWTPPWTIFLWAEKEGGLNVLFQPLLLWVFRICHSWANLVLTANKTKDSEQ